MKRFLAILFLLCAVAAKSALVSSNLFTLAIVNQTTNTGPALLMGTMTVPSTTFMLQSVGTGSTNFGGFGQILVGHNPNWSNAVPVGSFQFTNDTITSFTLTNNGVLPCYFFYQAINVGTTNMQQSAQAVQNR
jgi:hypothetical protein